MVEQIGPAGRPEERRDLIQRLTEREHAVLTLLAAGKSNKEIARALLITPDTAKAHVSRILHKLGVESRTEAAVLWTRAERNYEL